MDLDAIYDLCLPLLQDDNVDQEEKTERLEDLVQDKANLKGKALESAVLDVLWRFRNASTASTASQTVRHTVIRHSSPAPWQSSRSATPVGVSPRSAAASPVSTPDTRIRPPFFRQKSSQYRGSPFSSPKPSPQMAYAAPHIPHSPSLNAYESTVPLSNPDIYGDYGSDNVDWIVNDDTLSNPSSYNGDGSFYQAGGADWAPPNMVDMGPYDILRSVLRNERSDEEIEQVLEANGYDLSAAMASLMEAQNAELGQMQHPVQEPDRNFLVGKSMASGSRPTTPAGQRKSPVICRYWLSSGQCLRADCRFSHDLSNHVCKYWLAGNCLAGSSCIFSHDPSHLVAGLNIDGSQNVATPPLDVSTAQFNLQDYSYFPSLQNVAGLQAANGSESNLRNLYSSNDSVPPPPGFSTRPALAPEFIPSRPQSRPGSRHQSPGPRNSHIAMDDSEAFPSLGAAAVKGPKKHHGKRGHGHGHREKENTSSSLADVVRMSPSPNPVNSPRKGLKTRGSYANSRENSVAAQAIPAPRHIPWLETGDRANKAYLKARQEAIKHGGARNKFLQSAAQAWNRNDVRAAKALSLRGQSENDLMREAHREAAKFLYEERNKFLDGNDEVYIDLHGLHPAEAVSYLASALSNRKSSSPLHREATSYLYAIVGTGHHSKNGRDKVGRAIRAYLNECRYAFREFSAPGDKGSTGGILGIDSSSSDSSTAGRIGSDGEASREDNSSPLLQHGKVRILKAEDANEAGL